MQPQRATPSEQTYRQTSWQQANSGSQFSPTPATALSNPAHYHRTAPSPNASYPTSRGPDPGILQQQQQQQQQQQTAGYAPPATVPTGSQPAHPARGHAYGQSQTAHQQQQQQQQQQQHHGWSLPRTPQSDSSATRNLSPRLQALQSPHQQPAGARQAPRNQLQHSRVQHANSLAFPQEQERGQLGLQHFAQQHLQQFKLEQPRLEQVWQERQRNEVLSQEERRREEQAEGGQSREEQGREEQERKEEERREEERKEEGRRADLRKELKKEQQRREGQWREEWRQEDLERRAIQQQRQAEEAWGSTKQWSRTPPLRAPGNANPDPRLPPNPPLAGNAADSTQSSRPQTRYQDTPSARNQTHWTQHQLQGQPPQSQQLPDSISITTTNHHAPDMPSPQHRLDMAGPPVQYPHQSQAQQQPTQPFLAVVRQPTNPQSVQRQDPTSVVRPADSAPLISSLPVQIQPLSRSQPTGQVVPSPSVCFSRLTNLQAEPQSHSVTTALVPPPRPDARRNTEREKALVAIASSEFLTQLGMPIASNYIYGFLQHTHNFVILCEHFESLGHKFQRSDLARALQDALGHWHAQPKPVPLPSSQVDPGGEVLGELECGSGQTTNGSGCDAMVPQQPATVPNNTGGHRNAVPTSPQHMPLQIAPAKPPVPADLAENREGGPSGGKERHAAPQGMAGIASEHQPGFPPATSHSPPSRQTPPTSSLQQYLTINPMQIHKRPPLETFQDPPLAQPLPESDSPELGASALPLLAAAPPESIDGTASNIGSVTPPAQDVQHGPSESTATAATPALGGEKPTGSPKGIVLIDLTTTVTQEPQKLNGPLAEKIERRKAARVSKYDPREIARAILIVSQRHPTERPLNDHFLPLRENLSGQVNWQSDLSTIRWDILDPDPVDVDVGMDGYDEGELQANPPAALAPAKRSRPRKSRPSAAAGDLHHRQATPGSAETCPEGRAAHASRQRRLQHNTPGSAIENSSPSQTLQSTSAMEDGPNSKRRRTGQSTGRSQQRRTDAGSPAFKRYRCKWKGCSSELHNVDNLKRHVSKLHSKRDASSGCYSCQWAGCFRQPTSEQTAAGEEGNKLQLLVWEFANEEDWENHVGHHISAVRQAFGVGPAALTSGRRTQPGIIIGWLANLPYD